ncbi:hypothetical protein EZV62_002919 [Acer yangbiense]|nr:hypothetical protein EZV62_002919 [Acer yangbiense]
MVAHVGDFGLAKFLSVDPFSAASGTQSSSIGIKGTIGYVAPDGTYDLKPNNVLFDHDMVAHVGDFGLAKFLSVDRLSVQSGTQSSSTVIKGTIGYVAPVTTDNNNVENFARLHGEGRVLIEECLVGVLRIEVLCSMESLAERMEMTDVVVKLCAIRENFLSRRIRNVKPSVQ